MIPIDRLQELIQHSLYLAPRVDKLWLLLIQSEHFLFTFNVIDSSGAMVLKIIFLWSTFRCSLFEAIQVPWLPLMRSILTTFIHSSRTSPSSYHPLYHQYSKLSILQIKNTTDIFWYYFWILLNFRKCKMWKKIKWLNKYLILDSFPQKNINILLKMILPRWHSFWIISVSSRLYHLSILVNIYFRGYSLYLSDGNHICSVQLPCRSWSGCKHKKVNMDLQLISKTCNTEHPYNYQNVCRYERPLVNWCKLS